MKNLCNSAFVPPCMLAVILCCHAAGTAAAAAQHASDVRSLCLERSEAGREIALVETQLASVPALMRIPPGVAQPPILLWHGFGPPASERALMEALPLDEVPAIKVYLGLPRFGAREAPGGREDRLRRQAEDPGRWVFEPIVVGAAQELAPVVAALKELQCVGPQDKAAFSASRPAAPQRSSHWPKGRCRSAPP